jgi:hypothetical protein
MPNATVFPAALIAAMAMALSGAAAKPLSPDVRQVLVKGTSESCFANQVKAPANKDFTLGQLQTYCDCYANGFADNMQEEDMEKNQNGLTPEANKMATSISQKCAAGLKK